MHLALIISSLNSGGAERVLSELANHWAQNHQISIITLSNPDLKPFYHLCTDIHLQQLNQTTFESQSLYEHLKNVFKRIFLVRKTLKTLKPDIIISFIDIMNITTLLAGMGLKTPIIVSERTDPTYHHIPLLYQWLRLKTYPFARKIIVQTLSAASYFPNRFKDLLCIIPNAIKPTTKIFTIREAPRFLTCVGRLDSQKDHKTLILAFSKLIQNHKDLTLTIYGEGTERANLEQLVENLRLTDKILLPGTTKNISSVLIKSDLFIFPSRYEGFPNALCEAMAMGLPVIVSNCSGNNDIVQECVDGRIFPIGDVEALVQIADELLNDFNQRKQLSHNAKNITQRFNASHIFSQWDDIISNILKKKSLR